MTIPSKAIYIFNAIQIKISISLFTKIKKKLLKCIWKRPQISKVILIKMSTAAGTASADWKMDYRATLIKAHGT